MATANIDDQRGMKKEASNTLKAFAVELAVDVRIQLLEPFDDRADASWIRRPGPPSRPPGGLRDHLRLSRDPLDYLANVAGHARWL